MQRSFGEMFEDFVSVLGGYDPRAERAQQRFVATLMMLGSVGVTVTTAGVLLWQRGVIQKFLPEHLLKKANQVAYKIGELTEPPKATRLSGASKLYMTRVYSTAAKFFMYSFAGVYAFFKMPHFPLPLSIAGSLVPAGITFLLPREHVNPRSRSALLATSAFCVGYTLGPVNWVALDMTIHGAVSVLATATGFSVASFLTRGKVSYFIFSQVLSTALAILGSNAVLKSSIGYADSTDRGRQIIRMANVNAVLSLQLMSNIAVAVLHSLPTMIRHEKKAAAHAEYKRQHGLPEDEDVSLPTDTANFGSDDYEKEAYVIFGAAGYTLWTWFRYAWNSAVRKLLGKKGNSYGFTSRETDVLREAADYHKQLSRISDFAASLSFLYFYVRVVAYLQSTATVNPSLDKARRFFATVCPFVLVA